MICWCLTLKLKDNTHGKCTRDWIEADVNFVDKVGWVAYTHERTPRIDIILPAVKFFVVFKRKVIAFFFGF